MDPALRRIVVERAGSRCEYCHLHSDHQASVPFHVEHIVARQHGVVTIWRILRLPAIGAISEKDQT
jgi:hypothetical protein